MKHYLLATNRAWNVEAFMSWRSRLQGNWQLCVSPEDLEHITIKTNPRYVFFPHWSHIVSTPFLESHECVCFHMTDVPYGRGGSPLQNLIARGHKETTLTALRMTPEIDAGPVYLKQPLRLDGTAEDIFRRAAGLGMEMIEEIVLTEPAPLPQQGEPVFFKRRKPVQSKLPENGDLQDLYDHIRMLDAPGYPHAFLKYGDWLATMTNAEIKNGTVEARIKFIQSERNET